MRTYGSELDRVIGYWLGEGVTVDVILHDTIKRLIELAAPREDIEAALEDGFLEMRIEDDKKDEET